MFETQDIQELYFIETKQRGGSYVKIGVSNNVERRCFEIEKQTKTRPKILAIFGIGNFFIDGRKRSAVDVEQTLHYILRDYCQKQLGWGREWFSAKEALSILYWLKNITSDYIIYRPIAPTANIALWFRFCTAMGNVEGANLPPISDIRFYRNHHIYGEVIHFNPAFFVVNSRGGSDVFVKYNFPYGLEIDYFFKFREVVVEGKGAYVGHNLFIAGNAIVRTDHILGMALGEKIERLKDIPREYYDKTGVEEFSNPIYAKLDEIQSWYLADNYQSQFLANNS